MSIVVRSMWDPKTTHYAVEGNIHDHTHIWLYHWSRFPGLIASFFESKYCNRSSCFIFPTKNTQNLVPHDSPVSFSRCRPLLGSVPSRYRCLPCAALLCVVLLFLVVSCGTGWACARLTIVSFYLTTTSSH